MIELINKISEVKEDVVFVGSVSFWNLKLITSMKLITFLTRVLMLQMNIIMRTNDATEDVAKSEYHKYKNLVLRSTKLIIFVFLTPLRSVSVSVSFSWTPL